jgi:hypothetical protein
VAMRRQRAGGGQTRGETQMSGQGRWDRSQVEGVRVRGCVGIANGEWASGRKVLR